MQHADLILLDVNMPGAEDREDILQAAKLGILGYVLKSNFSLKDLLARVSKILFRPGRNFDTRGRSSIHRLRCGR